jgi:hypothetical protein
MLVSAMTLIRYVSGRPVRGYQYSDDVAGWMAERYASGEPGTTLAALHSLDPDNVPAPMIVRRWRRERPAFDALWIEACQCRAESLFDSALAVADDPEIVAASARVATDVRFRMAESLDAGRYGRKVELSARLTWDQLVAQSLECVAVDVADGGHPKALTADDTKDPAPQFIEFEEIVVPEKNSEEISGNSDFIEGEG